MKRLLAAAMAAILLYPTAASAACRTVSEQGVKVTVLPDRYWDQVAICESSKDGHTADWRDGGRFAGGLGIYIGTWRNYGGYEFARHPSKATRIEQIEIANRIAVFGYQTKKTFLTLDDRLNNRPYFRPPAGYYGWGCIAKRKSLNPKTWAKKARSKKCQTKSSKLHYQQSPVIR